MVTTFKDNMIPQPLTRLERNVLCVILCGYAILATLYSVYNPIFEASDELWHFPMVETIASTGKLPIQPLTPGESSGPWRQEGSQPPLYYAVGAWLTAWIDTNDMEQVRHLNPHVAAGEIRPDQNNLNLIVHNPILERFPWKGTVLAVHIVRFYSVLLGIWSVYLTCALVRELFPHHNAYALGASAIHAFTPMYLFISSSVNNDNLIVPLCTLALLLMVKTIKYTHPHPMVRSIKEYLCIGCVLALAVLTKASGLGLLPLVAATIAWQVWKRIELHDRAFKLPVLLQELPYALLSSACIILPLIAITGWWFYRNIQLYGDALGFNAFYAVLGMRDVPATMQQLWAERFAFAAGYWGNFGGLNVPMPQWIYNLLNTISVFAVIGVIIAFFQWLTKPDDEIGKPPKDILVTARHRIWPFAWDRNIAVLALSWAWPAAVFVSWSRWATLTWSSQGRLIFSALSMWSLALFIGIQTLTPPLRIALGTRHYSLKSLAPSVLALFLCFLCVIALPCWIIPAYTPPPNAEDEPPTSYVRRFGDTLLLRGYALEESVVQPGSRMQLTLYWEALNPTQSDHSIFIHILGTGERIIAQRDTFPGRGLVSTTWLQPGMMWSETHEIDIPKLAYAPDSLSLAIGMVDTQSGQRMPIFDDEQQYQGEMILLEHRQLKRPDSVIPNSINAQFGQGILLQGYDLNDVVIMPGQPLEITFYWSARASIEDNFTVSVQLIDTHWNKAGQNDNWPMNGTEPTSTWVAGETYIEQRSIGIDPNSIPGIYDLRIALYRINDIGELEHLPVVWNEGQMPATYLILTRIRVP